VFLTPNAGGYVKTPVWGIHTIGQEVV